MFNKSLSILIFITLIVSCNHDDDILPSGKYENGVLISNEGNFFDADGSVSFYDPNTRTVLPKIYESENQRPFGGLLQSIGIHEEYVYLIDNLGSKIEIVDINTFSYVKPILAGLSQPRYFVANGNQGFISNWGPYADDFSSPASFIALLDTEENLLGKQIEVPSRPEGLIISNGKLYVSSMASNTVTIIDIETLEISATIETAFGPSFFVQDKNNNIWVACLEGKLIAIDPNTDQVIVEKDVPDANGKIALDGSGENIYLITNVYAPDFSFTENDIIKVNINNPNDHQSIYSSRNLYGIGIDPLTNTIYLANSNAFIGNGTIILIDSEGNEVTNFATGRGPNGFVFRN